MGKTPYRAAIDAADEIGLAVIATSLTIVAVFAPVSFMPGIPGQYFRQFGLTVAIAVLFSLAVARLITPLMAAYLMRAKDAHEEHDGDGWIMRGYSAFVSVTLHLRYLTLVGAIGALAVSIYFLMQVPGSFIPPEDVSRIPISVELPPGATLDDTDKVTEEMRQAIKGIDGIEDVFVLGGASPTGQLDVRRASVTVLLDPLDHSLGFKLKELGAKLPLVGGWLPEPKTDGRTRTQSEIEAEIFAAIAPIPDIRAFKLNDRGERDISYSILSSNEDDLNTAVARLEGALRGDPLLANVAAAGALPRPEIQIIPRPGEAARMGVTTRSIADTLRVATLGDVDAALAKISLDGRQVPVRVQMADGFSTDLGRLGALKVPTASGTPVPLNAVADLTVGTGPAMIDRLNRERRATIGANLPPGVPLGTATDRFKELVAGVELPASVKVAEAGDAEVLAEMQQSFVNAMILGLMLVLSVLILLFRSVIQPFTILLSLPLAIGGVAAGLLLTGNSLSMPVLIGILMLMGIVTKNAILLVDFGIEMQARGMNRFDAMIEAGRKRARPIVMTSIAMSAGMLPSALGVGEGGTFRAPMAIAVIGGIIVSTVLSLIVVPSFSLIMDDLGRLLGWLFKGIVGAKEAEPEPVDPAVLATEMEANRGEIERLKDRLHDLESRESWTPALPRHVAE
jgi:multidrug efflux pump subunit AcrB